MQVVSLEDKPEIAVRAVTSKAVMERKYNRKALVLLETLNEGPFVAQRSPHSLYIFMCTDTGSTFADKSIAINLNISD